MQDSKSQKVSSGWTVCTKQARQAFDTVVVIKFSIPPRSTNIENIFDCVKSELHTQAFEKNINNERFSQFSIRVKHTLENTPTKYIDKTIKSMPKKILMVIKSKGQRIKYKK